MDGLSSLQFLCEHFEDTVLYQILFCNINHSILRCFHANIKFCLAHTLKVVLNVEQKCLMENTS